ncbi:hypothetical protein MA16_Dca022488 [Dendrobium catenatum]|uniref:Uncharacterized protein n=1 Tax=Dendrobium catenatum TaxID=906689 RepID=A0A2I0XFZ0_9ASPA|nr:hypothetical protein MA16_Dca022488 [Dendrobium catenatum]
MACLHFAEIKESKTIPSAKPLEVREAAYAAARERIFSLNEANEKEVVPPKTRKVPVVAQRMIAHALGQKASYLHKCEGNDKYEVSNVCSSKDAKETSEHFEIRKPVPYQKKGGKFPAKNSGYDCSSEPNGNMRDGLAAHRKVASTEFLERERIGAAKRIFAQALGTASKEVKPSNTEPLFIKTKKVIRPKFMSKRLTKRGVNCHSKAEKPSQKLSSTTTQCGREPSSFYTFQV